MKPIFLVLAAFAAATLVTGCGSHGGETRADVIAHINNETITRGEYITRMQNITAVDLSPALQPGGPTFMAKAGEYALRSLVDQKLALQLAASQGCMPTPAEVTTYIAFAKKYQDPRLTLIGPDPFRNDDDWTREALKTVAYRKMMVKLAGINQADLDKTYGQYKSKLRSRDQYHVRLIDVKAKAKAEGALAAIIKGTPFETIALTQSEDPISGPKGGDIGTIPDTALSQQMPHVFALVKALKPGQYTRTVTLENVIPHGTVAGTQPVPEPRYFLAQLVALIPGAIPTEAEVKPLLEIVAMNGKDPNVGQRLQSMMKDYLNKAKLDITLPGYEHILDAVKQSGMSAVPRAPQ